MLVTTAIVPGSPAIVTELMGSASPELDDLRGAADSAVSRVLSDLLAASAGCALMGSGSVQLVVVGPGAPGEFNAAGPVSFVSFGRDFVVAALAQAEYEDCDLPTPIMVARYLGCRDVAAHPEHGQLWASARWITTRGSDATALGEQLSTLPDGVGLILVADGAACHGPKAPRAQDSRAAAYDEGVCAALASGRRSHLARIDADLGDELGATGAQVWPVLVAAAGGDEIGEVLWAGAPYGVGYVVAGWGRSLPSAASTHA